MYRSKLVVSTYITPAIDNQIEAHVAWWLLKNVYKFKVHSCNFYICFQVESRYDLSEYFLTLECSSFFHSWQGEYDVVKAFLDAVPS